MIQGYIIIANILQNIKINHLIPGAESVHCPHLVKESSYFISITRYCSYICTVVCYFQMMHTGDYGFTGVGIGETMI